MSRTALERAVEERLDRKVFVNQHADVVVELEVSHSSASTGWLAIITLRSEKGTWLGAREIESDGERCSEMADSLALVLALMIDVPGETRPDSGTPKSSKPVTPPRSTRIHLPGPLLDAPPEAWQVEATVNGVMAVGLLPGFATGIRAALGIDPPEFWQTELGGSIWRTTSAETAGAGSSFSMLSADLLICPFTLKSPRTRLAACARQRLGKLTATGFGFDENRQQSRVAYSLGARIGLSLAILEPLELVSALGFELPLTRDRFYYTGLSDQHVSVYRVAPVIGTAELGIGLSFH